MVDASKLVPGAVVRLSPFIIDREALDGFWRARLPRWGDREWIGILPNEVEEIISAPRREWRVGDRIRPISYPVWTGVVIGIQAPFLWIDTGSEVHPRTMHQDSVEYVP